MYAKKKFKSENNETSYGKVNHSSTRQSRIVFKIFKRVLLPFALTPPSSNKTSESSKPSNCDVHFVNQRMFLNYSIFNSSLTSFMNTFSEYSSPRHSLVDLEKKHLSSQYNFVALFHRTLYTKSCTEFF